MNKGVIIAIVVVVLLIILGGGYYWYSSSKSTTKPPATNNGSGGNNGSGASPPPYVPPAPTMGAPRADWMCGPNYGNAQCPKGTWCGPYQLCGTTDAHKAQSAFSSYSNP